MSEADRLAKEIAEHKHEIGRRRRRLKAAAEALRELRTRCAELGIAVVVDDPTLQ